jgi:hypothetical protein
MENEEEAEFSPEEEYDLFRRCELEAISAIAVKLLRLPPASCGHEPPASFSVAWRRK